jgi:hypothetical protein
MGWYTDYKVIVVLNNRFSIFRKHLDSKYIGKPCVDEYHTNRFTDEEKSLYRRLCTETIVNAATEKTGYGYDYELGCGNLCVKIKNNIAEITTTLKREGYTSLKTLVEMLKIVLEYQYDKIEGTFNAESDEYKQFDEPYILPLTVEGNSDDLVAFWSELLSIPSHKNYIVVISNPDGVFEDVPEKFHGKNLDKVITDFFDFLVGYYTGETCYQPESIKDIEISTELLESSKEIFDKYSDSKFIARLSYGTNGGWNTFFQWLVFESN